MSCIVNRIRVAVCDDELTICKYYQNVIEKDDELEFVGKATNIPECKALLESSKPDILLLDLQLEYSEAGFKILSIVPAVSPETKVIMLTMYDSDENFFTALENGADYFLNKTITSKQLVESIKKRYNNHSDFDDYLENRLLSSGISLSNENKSLLFLLNVLKNLTKSEIEVLSDLCKGLSYSEISQKRFVTENTVRSQIVRMVSKIKCKNIKELVNTAKSLDIFKFYNL